MKWRTHVGQGPSQNLQQWSRLMQNGQKFGSVLWRMLEWKSMSMKELHTQPITKVSP